MMQHIKDLFSDASVQVSATRVVLVLFYLTVIGIWGWVSIKAKTVADIPAGVTGLGASLALLKGAQSFAEKN